MNNQSTGNVAQRLAAMAFNLTIPKHKRFEANDETELLVGDIDYKFLSAIDISSKATLYLLNKSVRKAP